MPQKTVLDNGLRLVTEKLPGSKSLTALVLVGAGSRYENSQINGISHFLEHMFFKGGDRYQNARSVAEEVDSMGGEFNAFTGKQYAGYFVKVAAQYLPKALDVLADMLTNARFKHSDIDRERGVVLEEYNMYQDTPSYQVGWDMEKLLYGDQPMSWDQLGGPEFLARVSQQDLTDYHAKLYTPDNAVLSIVGNLDHDEARALVEKFFQFKNAKKAYQCSSLEAIVTDKKIIIRKRYTKQSHLTIGFPAYGEADDRTWAMKVLAMLLGGNMSSRMFTEVREKKSLAYSIKTNTDDYTDTGILSTQAAVNTERVTEAIKAIVSVYKTVRDEGVSEEELKKAKSCLKGKILLTLEDSEEFAHLLGKFELLHNQYLTPEIIMQKIDAVTLNDLNQMTRDLFQSDKIRAALVGPFENQDQVELEQLLKF